MKKWKCSGERVAIIFLFVIGLIVIAETIYLSYQINRAKIIVDDSIRKINEEIYPKEVSILLNRLLQQSETVDQYLTESKFDHRKFDSFFHRKQNCFQRDSNGIYVNFCFSS